MPVIVQALYQGLVAGRVMIPLFLLPGFLSTGECLAAPETEIHLPALFVVLHLQLQWLCCLKHSYTIPHGNSRQGYKLVWQMPYRFPWLDKRQIFRIDKEDGYFFHEQKL